MRYGFTALSQPGMYSSLVGSSPAIALNSSHSFAALNGAHDYYDAKATALSDPNLSFTVPTIYKPNVEEAPKLNVPLPSRSFETPEKLQSNPIFSALSEYIEYGQSAASAAVHSAREFFGSWTDDIDKRAQLIGLTALAATASVIIAGCSGGAAGSSSELTKVLMDAVLFKAFGGLGVFLLGMKLMSDGLHSVSGSTLKKVLGALTTNRFAALAVGTGVTAVIQSSSVTTVMTVGLVDAGLMNLTQAMGVVFGANIGTTITGWLFALKIAKYGLPIIGTGSIPYLFLNKNERVENIGKAIVGIGLVFLGLTTMAAGFEDPLVKEALHSFFSTMSGSSHLGILKCIIAAAIATEIVQSSSATLGVTIALAKAGVIPFETAAALIFGLNIGTTITAVLAALRRGTSIDARRVALSHVMYNLIGAAIVFPFAPQYIKAIDHLAEAMGSADIASKVAFSHTAFNVLASALFISFLPHYKNLVTRILSDKLASKLATKGPKLPALAALSPTLLKFPRHAVQAAYKVIDQMGIHVETMLDDLSQIIGNGETSSEKGQRIAKLEDELDIMQTAIFAWHAKVRTKKMDDETSAQISAQRTIVDQLETIGDRIRDITKRIEKSHSKGREIPEKAKADLQRIHENVASYLMFIISSLGAADNTFWIKAASERARIAKVIKKRRKAHDRRIQNITVPSDIEPTESCISTFYLDILGFYDAIIGRAKNIADAVAGQKKYAPHKKD
ncbi:MAG: Na/Pi cotransporter family protein [Pseudomonadota bacterium]